MRSRHSVAAIDMVELVLSARRWVVGVQSSNIKHQSSSVDPLQDHPPDRVRLDRLAPNPAPAVDVDEEAGTEEHGEGAVAAIGFVDHLVLGPVAPVALDCDD